MNKVCPPELRAASSGLQIMQITLNGEIATVPSACSVADLLAERGLVPVRVAVERNEELVPRRSFTETKIREGDRIEIVTFVGGG